MGEFEHKMHLYGKYVDEFGDEEMQKRLGLKDWEVEYFKKVYGRLRFDTTRERPVTE